MGIRERVGLPLAALTASSFAIVFASRGEALDINNDVASPIPAPTPEATASPQVSDPNCIPVLRWGEKGETPGVTIIEGSPNKCICTMVLEDVNPEPNPITPFALATLGLVVVSGGAWAVARTRR